MEIKKTPVLIIGSGIAGLLTALKLSDSGIASLVATKTRLEDNSSRLAQGGIAAVLPSNSFDSIELHVEDTLNAGAGLSNEKVVRSILSEGHLAIQDLVKLGVPFDKSCGDKLALTKEAAHTTSRILHAGGDATGKSILDTLINKVKKDPNIEVLEECIALNLMVYENRCYGVQAISYNHNNELFPKMLLAQNVVLATGGIGQLYSQTTNPPVSTGDGIALAYKAGAKIQDMEFIQFHPTAFWLEERERVEFLISEALRGEGGILRDKQKRPFAKDYHPAGEMAPRDIVTRAIFAQIQKDERPYVYLDITHLSSEVIECRFPNILQRCLEYNIDIRKDMIPVAPAAHYGMGGVCVDLSGQTSIKNLYAVGEVVSSGLHGANRLASNSLLECVVLARRVAAHIETFSEILPMNIMEKFPSFPVYLIKDLECTDELKENILQLRNLMWKNVGIIRNGQELQHAKMKIDTLEEAAQKMGLFRFVPHGVELAKMLTVSRLICDTAIEREESIGAHYRRDFSQTLPVSHHSVCQKELRKGLKHDVYTGC